jgi:hypothetical protein
MDWLLDHDRLIIRHFLKVERDVLGRYCEALERDFQHLCKEAQPTALHDANLAERFVSIEDALRKVVCSAPRRRYHYSANWVIRTGGTFTR